MAISLSTSSGPTAGGTAVTITGTGGSLVTTSSVKFGLASATIVGTPTATTVDVTSPAGSGVVPVTVTTAGGSSAPVSWFYVPPPIKTGISPSSGLAAGGDTVTITGQNLSAATAVDFGTGNPGTITASGAGSITVTSPAGTGTVSVSVTTPGGTIDGVYFGYCATPTVTAPTTGTPATGSEAGGNAVSITGTNLTGTTAITFGALAAPFVVISATEVDAIVPAGTGTVDVGVTTCGGTATVTGGYTYIAPP
ncbi:MAG: IPT/TIG domain-containing protein [Pseudonocardiaceae bacterium]